MIYAAIGGMQLKHWTGYFRIIIPTLKVLKLVRKTQGCVHADTFKAGQVFFAVSVWDSEAQMKEFARSGLYGQLMSSAMRDMALFHNHTEKFDTVPTRAQSVAAWEAAMVARGGKGTVGAYSM